MLAWRSNVESAVMSASGQGRAEVCLGANWGTCGTQSSQWASAV